jgi:UDP-N-acetylmuramoyl-tripeptide--D-alanyl-D-alanine ligase
MSAMHHGAVMEGSWGSADKGAVNVSDSDAALALLRSELQPGDVVLVKASNSAGLGALADALAHDDREGGEAGRSGSSPSEGAADANGGTRR